MATKKSPTKEWVLVFQELLNSYGIKLSQQKAWNLFKAIIVTIVSFVLKLKGRRLSMAGVGAFYIDETKPRQSKIGVYKFVPRFKFKPSSVINGHVEYELADEIMEKPADAKNLVKEGDPLKVPALPDEDEDPAPKPKKEAKPAAKPVAKPAPKAKKVAEPEPDDGEDEDFFESE